MKKTTYTTNRMMLLQRIDAMRVTYPDDPCKALRVLRIFVRESMLDCGFDVESLLIPLYDEFQAHYQLSKVIGVLKDPKTFIQLQEKRLLSRGDKRSFPKVT